MMGLISNLWDRLKRRLDFFIIRYGTQKFMIYILASLALFNAFVPMTPNIFVVILAILQPNRNVLTVVLFAISAAISAFLFALLLSEFSDSAEVFGLKMFGEHWETAQQMIAQFGPGLLIALSIFPDIPRPSIALVAFSGVGPVSIALMVLTGKLVLYSTVIGLVNSLPKFLAKQKSSSWKVQRWFKAKAKRFQAYRRRLEYRVMLSEKSERL